MHLRRAALLLPLLLLAAWFAWRWGTLPESVPLSADPHPDPRAILSRQAFLSKAFLWVGAVTAAFGVSAILSPRMMERGHARTPSAAYWLAPERLATTIARSVAMMEVAGIALAAIIGLQFILVGEGAIAGRPRDLLGTRVAVLFATVGLVANVWFYAPFVAHWLAERRGTR